MKFIHHLISKVMEKDQRVVFAYLYGSTIHEEQYRDIDIGIYMSGGEDPQELSSDLKIALSAETAIPPDQFDVQIINNADNLLYLEQVLNGQLLVDKDTDLRGDFIESFSMRYREAEGILREAFF
jgi:uncharacterized protein